MDLGVFMGSIYVPPQNLRGYKHFSTTFKKYFNVFVGF